MSVVGVARVLLSHTRTCTCSKEPHIVHTDQGNIITLCLYKKVYSSVPHVIHTLYMINYTRTYTV